MTELALTPPRLRRLFQTIDLAPLPQDRTIEESLDMWRKRRGSALAPAAADMFRDQTHIVLDHSLLVEPLPGLKDFAIGEVGSAARLLLGQKYSGDRLSQLGDRRIAARLRQLCRMVLDYGEAVIVKFGEGNRGYEVLAAPMNTRSGETALFCTLTFDDLPVK